MQLVYIERVLSFRDHDRRYGIADEIGRRPALRRHPVSAEDQRDARHRIT
jgi:hypothetical protein